MRFNRIRWWWWMRLKCKNAVQLQPHRTYIRRPAPAAAEGEDKAFE